MSMRLDRTRPFGKIAGEIFIPEGCDRAALYEQDGRMFDAHDRLIEPGVTLAADPGKPKGTDVTVPPSGVTEVVTVADLLRQADSMHWRTFKKAAEGVLGATCPAGKAQIIEALRAAQREFDARAERKAASRPEIADHDDEVGGVAPPVQQASSGVDLSRWARGQQEYLWGDVRKAIKARYGRNVTERDDAVEFLVDQGLINAAEARQDVIRDAE